AEKLCKITDPDGAATQFAYTGLLQLATITDRAGAATDLRYDPLNQLDTVEAPVMQGYTGASVRPTVALTSPDRVVWQPQTPGTSLSAPKANVQPASVMATVVDAGWTFAFGALKRSEEHTSELQSRGHLVCRLLLEKKNC